MRNYKLEHNLIGLENWWQISTIFIKGIAGEQEVSSKKSQEENEKIIQSWNNIAILRATSEKPTKFYPGFYNQTVISYLKHEFKTDFEFGMRIGPGNVNFFVFPEDFQTPIRLELIKQTTEDDPKYKDLIVI